MSDIPFPLLFIMLVFFIMWRIVHKFHRLEQAKRALPERAAYLATHSQAEPACTACGSSALKDEGLTHGKDHRRIVSCGQCQTLLYRDQQPEAY